MKGTSDDTPSSAFSMCFRAKTPTCLSSSQATRMKWMRCSL